MYIVYNEVKAQNFFFLSEYRILLMMKIYENIFEATELQFSFNSFINKNYDYIQYKSAFRIKSILIYWYLKYLRNLLS